jgi:hypothetical protein
MKKEWLFFCAFFSANLSPAISHARLIAKFSFIAVNNTITSRINIDPDRHYCMYTASNKEEPAYGNPVPGDVLLHDSGRYRNGCSGMACKEAGNYFKKL